MRPDDIHLESQPLLEEAGQPFEADESRLDPANVLPADVFGLILDRLPYTALAASAQVNQKWRRLADRDDRWEAEFERTFPVDYAFAKNNNKLIRPRKRAFKKEYRSYTRYLSSVQKKLFHYCQEGNWVGVQRLIPSLVPKELCVFVGGKNLLKPAAELGRTDILNCIYEEVVLPAYRDNPNNFPLLYYAVATQQSYDVMLAIIEQTNSLELTDGDGHTPLHLACAHGDEERVRWLIEKGANIDAITEAGFTPLHWAILVDAEGVLDVVNLLIRAKANLVFPENQRGSSPLYTACLRGNEAVVLALLAAGCSAHIQGNNGSTPFYVASQCGHVKIVKHLLLAGAIVDQKKRGGYTALGVASLNGYPEVVQELVAAGASVNHKGDDGETALSCAIQENHSAVIKVLTPHILKAIMKTQLEESQETQYGARFAGFFGIKLSCFSVYQAAFALHEYIHGCLEASALKEYGSTINWHEDLKSIFKYYSQHPEIIEVSNHNVPDILRDYSFQNTIVEKEKLAEKIHSICKEEEKNVEAYLALALLRMEKAEDQARKLIHMENAKNKDLDLDLIHVEKVEEARESLLLSQSKFDSAFIWLKSLDPNFDQVKARLEHWARQAIIPKGTARLFLQKISGFAAAQCNEDESVSGSVSFSR